ncbi:MAG: HNH endonuclease family protein [Hyphomicrobiales bacterium]|nr:HNH endonuclease family protein [Hyphomicrobiales bacterium]
MKTMANNKVILSNNETAMERQGLLLHSLGNLTLLAQELDWSVSNGPYDKKRPEIASQSALRLNTYFREAPTWDENVIRNRGCALFDQAKKIWQHPGKKE